MSMSKIDPVEKLQTIRLILEGKETQRHAADRLGIRLPSIQQWISMEIHYIILYMNLITMEKIIK